MLHLLPDSRSYPSESPSTAKSILFFRQRIHHTLLSDNQKKVNVKIISNIHISAG